MPLPLMLQGDSRARLIQGAVVGSVLTMVVGFGFSGWQMQSNVDRRTEASVTKAVVAVLTPICVDRFRTRHRRQGDDGGAQCGRQLGPLYVRGKGRLGDVSRQQRAQQRRRRRLRPDSERRHQELGCAATVRR